MHILKIFTTNATGTAIPFVAMILVECLNNEPDK